MTVVCFCFSTGETCQLALACLIRFRGHCVHLGGENFPNSQQSGKNSRVPCPNSFQSRFPGCSQFPNPVKIFCVFPNPALYFGQIPDPENTLPDPVLILNLQKVLLFQLTLLVMKNLKAHRHFYLTHFLTEHLSLWNESIAKIFSYRISYGSL